MPNQSATLAIPSADLILDNLPLAIILADEKHRICYANAAVENLFQMSIVNICKLKLEQLLPHDSTIFDLLSRSISVHGPVNDYQIDISTQRMGSSKIVDVQVVPIDNRVMLVFRERTMADRIDRQLSHRGAARSASGLAAMLAHEIKNPLSGIRGAAQLLQSVVKHPDTELAELITNETDRIVQLVDRMEVFSDHTPLESEPVNMHSILGTVRAVAENGFGKGVTFTESYDPSLPPVIGSKDQLIQVFLNLAKNAVEAMDETPNKEIRLASAYRSGIHMSTPGSIEKASLGLEFSVTDTGPGVPEDIKPYLFEPFVTTRINGSGLGLALVAKIIGQHGGIIEFDSSSEGTSFRVLLPAWSKNTEELHD